MGHDLILLSIALALYGELRRIANCLRDIDAHLRIDNDDYETWRG